MGDSLFGVVGKDCVVLAADSHVDAHGIINMDDDKIFASAGPQGDRTYFMEYIQKNIHLYRLRNSVKLSPFAAASFTRSELARMLRSSPHQVDLLCAGYDEKGGPKLYYIDYLSAMGDVKRAAHGYG